VLVELNAAASKAGVPSHARALSLLLSALTLVDASIPDGATREQFLGMAGIVYDKLRGSLTTGAIA